MPNKLTLNDFIEKATSIHNGIYSYNESIYINNKTKIKIICHKHGLFEQSPSKHLSGHGCQQCGNFSNKTLSQFIIDANIIHDEFYDYSKSNYINRYTKIDIICPIHGEFHQTPADHLTGRGCIKCGRINNIEKQLTSIFKFIEQSNIIHNNKYDYSLSILKGMMKKIIIICDLHGKFLQRPDNHIRGIGCPSCGHIISKPEILWLDSIGIDKEHRHLTIILNNKKFNVDGYDPKTNTIYEFYGDFWHGNPKIFPPNKINAATKTSFGELYNKTISREIMLKTGGYNVITIWESDFKSSYPNG